MSASLVLGILLLKNFDEYDQISSGGDYAKVVAWLLIANSVVSLIDLIIGCIGLQFATSYLLVLVRLHKFLIARDCFIALIFIQTYNHKYVLVHYVCTL